jgi:predicted lipoprotein
MAEETDADDSNQASFSWTAANLRIVDEYAVPAFSRFLNASRQQEVAIASFCKQTNAARFDAVRAGFHQQMDAWQGVQMLRLGPAELFMRHSRVQMWPDRHSTGARQMRKLRGTADVAALSAERFARTSVALQGLPAMERLLFASGSSHASFDAATADSAFDCQLLHAIAMNQVNIAGELLKEWRLDYRQAIANPGEDNDYFETAEEATAQFLNQLYTQLQAIIDQKQKRPFEKQRFRLKRAESWRSGRSIRNVVLNLRAAQDLYQVAFANKVQANESGHELDGQISQGFTDLIKGGATLMQPLADVQAQKPEQLKAWWQAISAMKRRLGAELPKAINIPLGFNSLDGD